MRRIDTFWQYVFVTIGLLNMFTAAFPPPMFATTGVRVGSALLGAWVGLLGLYYEEVQKFIDRHM